MNLFTEKIVFCGFVIAWFRATRPTKRSPFLFTATTEGTSLSPSADGITIGSPPLITAATELVVPKSIPIIFAIISSFKSFNVTGLKVRYNF